MRNFICREVMFPGGCMFTSCGAQVRPAGSNFRPLLDVEGGSRFGHKQPQGTISRAYSFFEVTFINKVVLELVFQPFWRLIIIKKVFLEEVYKWLWVNNLRVSTFVNYPHYSMTFPSVEISISFLLATPRFSNFISFEVPCFILIKNYQRKNLPRKEKKTQVLPNWNTSQITCLIKILS